MGTLTLITGGLRSGKSRHALELARQRARNGSKCFVATAEVLDEEMKARILEHRRQRGPDFFTIEESVRLAEAIQKTQSQYDLVLVDCLTLWLNNLFFRLSATPVRIKSEIRSFVETVRLKKTDILLVTNEVGLGLIPDNPLGRRFIDELGSLNQELGRFSDEVILMVSGVPKSIKGGVGAGLDS